MILLSVSLKNCGVPFQAYYYGDAMNIDKNLRDRFRSFPEFEACEYFCKNWDEVSSSFVAANVHLHYGDYRSRLVPFEDQKNIFYILKRL